MKLGTPAGPPRSNDIRPNIAAATASVCSYTASAARSSLVLISCLHPSMLQLRIDDLVLQHGAKLVFDRNCSKHEQILVGGHRCSDFLLGRPNHSTAPKEKGLPEQECLRKNRTQRCFPPRVARMPRHRPKLLPASGLAQPAMLPGKDIASSPTHQHQTPTKSCDKRR